MDSIKQGATLYVILVVNTVAGAPKVLDGGAAVLAYSKLRSEDVLQKTGTIDNNVITFKFTPEETAVMAGKYEIEVKAKDSFGDVAPLYSTDIEVEESLIPNYR